MLLPLAYYGNPLLRKKCQQVEKIDDELKQFVMDMTETMVTYHGIGLAAPQVHRPLNFFITKVPFKAPDGKELEGVLRVFINPQILSVSEELWLRTEGCLSIPGIYGEIERPLKVRVEYTDLDGKRRTDEFQGLEARCILHENDHINGVLFVDRIKGKERKHMESALKQIKRKYNPKD